MMSVVPAISVQQFDYSGSVAGATHTPAKSAQLGKIVLTVTKRNPEQFTLPGFYRLLPQLVGSCDPGGVGVSGDGDAARIGLLGQREWRNLTAVSPHNVAGRLRPEDTGRDLLLEI
jgi:hypothetical protein